LLGAAFLAITAIAIGLFAAYNLFHYILYLLVIHPKDASNIGHALNAFEQRQLVEWTPKAEDFLKHDDEQRTYDDVFGPYRSEYDNYSTCVFPRAIFTHPYESDYALLKPVQQGMRFLDLGCGSGAAAGHCFRLRLPRTCGQAFRRDLRVRVDRLYQGPGRLAGALLAISQAWRATAYSFAGITRCLSSRA